MPVEAKTIQICLSDGDPRCIGIAEITTRIVQAVQVPRSATKGEDIARA